MAGEITLARRYARALLAVTTDLEQIGRVEKDLYGVAEAYAGSPELRTYLGSPSFRRDQKKAVLKQLFGDRIDPVSLRFLEVLVDKSRIRWIQVIAEAYDEANDAIRDVAKATVTSFLPLTDAQRKALLGRLQKFTQRSNVRLEEKVDPKLLGGLEVRIGDTVLDGSVKGRLERLADHLWLAEHEKSTKAVALAAESLAHAGG